MQDNFQIVYSSVVVLCSFFQVAGSVSQLLTAISLDDKHEQERAAILGSRIDTSSLLQTSQSIYNSNYYDDSEVSSSGMDESLDDFELTCHDIYTDMKSTPSTYSSSSSSSSPPLTTSSTITSLPQYPKQTHHSFDTNRSVTAPLSAGVRGLMHGIVGGMTSIVTQPYRGAKEDQLRVSHLFFKTIFVIGNKYLVITEIMNRSMLDRYSKPEDIEPPFRHGMGLISNAHS